MQVKNFYRAAIVFLFLAFLCGGTLFFKIKVPSADLTVCIQYEKSAWDGTEASQLFYTERGEVFSEEKSIRCDVGETV